MTKLTIITLVIVFGFCKHDSNAQKPLNEAAYNIEVRFQRSFGTIGSDGTANDPEPSWQIKVANDIDNQENDLLDNTPSFDNPGKYCYWLTTANNNWHPVQDTLLGLFQNNTTGKFDFEIMSYENDYSDQCIFHYDGPDGINDDDNMDYIEDIHTFKGDANPGAYIIVEKQVNANSKVEFKYAWRYKYGTRNAPLDFGDINSCNQYVHANSNLKESPNTQIHYTNDWSTTDNAAFSSSEDVTYTFYNSRPRQLDFTANFNFDGIVHLVKVDNSGNLLTYIENSQSILETKIGEGYYALIFEGEESNGSNDPNGTFSFTVILNNIFSIGTPTFPDNIIYVNEQGSGLKDGSSWQNASPDLYLAIETSKASSVKDIWVAKGTYFPTECGTQFYRNIWFKAIGEIRLYGGFEGNEATNFDLSKRNGYSTLSGNIGNLNSDNDNSHRVMELNNLTATSIIDGFIVEKGKTPSNVSGGAGILIKTTSNSFPTPTYTITNCKIRDNTSSGPFSANNGNGAGVLFQGQESRLFFENCSFENNIATAYGGAFYTNQPANNSRVSFLNCLFSGNEAETGGVIYNAIGFNGIIRVTFTNSTFRNNKANIGSVLFQIGVSNFASISFRNSIFWNDPNVMTSTLFRNSYSLAEINIDHCLLPYASCSVVEDSLVNGDLTCINNIFATDPQFVSTTNSNLAIGSPARNTGDNTLYAGSFPALSTNTDLQRRPRIAQNTIDMGAYESLERIYVNAKASAGGNGSSWDQGFIALQDALLEAGEIWVAKGTYKPSTGIERTASYIIPDGTKIYGGFSGLEPSSFNLDQREISLNQTILSGDIGLPNDNSDNSYNIIYTQNVSDQTILDGFTITGGNANAASGVNSAGGAWHNDGSGFGNSSKPQVSNCTFYNNSAVNGGAFYNNGEYSLGTSPTFTNTLFYENVASSSGGAIFNQSSNGNVSSVYSNCTFANNVASFNGGAIMTSDGDGSSNPVIRNSIFWGNLANGLSNSYSSFDLEEVISISHSLFQETNCIALNTNNDGIFNCDAGVIFAQNPLFLDASLGLFHLDCNSPAINQGTITDAPLNDISGFLRVGNPDMGAYEFGHAEVVKEINDDTNPTITGIPILQANSKILNTNNAFYQASKHITLKPGFEISPLVGNESVFKAEIGGGCP